MYLISEICEIREFRSVSTLLCCVFRLAKRFLHLSPFIITNRMSNTQGIEKQKTYIWKGIAAIKQNYNKLLVIIICWYLAISNIWR